MGWKFGATGKCFTGPQGRSQAVKQGRAIKASAFRNDEIDDAVLRIRRRQAQGIKKPKKKPPAKLPVWIFPFPVEREYEKVLLAFVDSLSRTIAASVTPHLQSLLDERNLILPEAARSDDFADSIERLIAATSLAFDGNAFEKAAVATRVGNQTNNWNDKEWTKQKRAAFGVDIVQREPFINSSINSFVKENVALISKMENEYLRNIEGTVQRGIRSGETIASLTKEIQDVTGKTKNRARLLARDQVGKLNGDLTELRQTNLGVEKYKWRDSDDSRVRPNHRTKDGRTFSWDKPPPDTGHPGEDIQCRCYAEPIFDDIFEELTP